MWLVIEIVDHKPNQVVRKDSYEDALDLASEIARENGANDVQDEIALDGGVCYPGSDNGVWISEV